MQPYPGNDPYQQYPQEYQQYPQEYQQYPEYRHYEQYERQPPTYAPPPYQAGYTAPAVAYQVPGQRPTNTTGLLAMIFGLVSIPVFLCCYGVLSLGLGTAAIVLGSLGLRKVNAGQATNRGQAMAGVVCGAAGIACAAVWLVLLITINLHVGFGT